LSTCNQKAAFRVPALRQFTYNQTSSEEVKEGRMHRNDMHHRQIPVKASLNLRNIHFNLLFQAWIGNARASRHKGNDRILIAK